MDEAVLLPELFGLIKTWACAASPAIMRATLRLVCKAWHQDDRDFVTPEWCTEHPDIIDLPPIALLLFKDAIKRMAYQHAWANIPTPSTITWTETYGCWEKEKMRLRFYWPQLRERVLSVRFQNGLDCAPDDYNYCWGHYWGPHVSTADEFIGTMWSDNNNAFRDYRGREYKPPV